MKKLLPISSKVLLLSLSAITILLASCSSIKSYPTGSPSSFYFKDANDAEFQRNWGRAVRIYKMIQLEYANDLYTVIEAEFSIAQAYLSWGSHKKQAAQHFLNVIAFYQRPDIGTAFFPDSFLILAEKNLKALEDSSRFHLLPPKTDGVHSVSEDESLQNDN